MKEDLGLLSPGELEEEIARAVQFLSAQPGVRQVWLFGSAVRGWRLDWRSDLDFAVAGLAPDALYGGWSRLDSLLRGPVDLVRIEDASPLLRSQILDHGRLLYEA
ncbi:MAG: nucleotidyltransferase domain-containing protein [Verrucomicrobiae bacterium]|nr:nucleotidyltransferase domain-containing protein [Verrucomicrobiae bacterium]